MMSARVASMFERIWITHCDTMTLLMRAVQKGEFKNAEILILSLKILFLVSIDYFPWDMYKKVNITQIGDGFHKL